VDGPRVAVEVHSLCVHGDTPGAVAAARAIRAALEQQGWLVVAPSGQVATRERAEVTRGSLGAAEDQDRPGSGPTPVAASDAGGIAGDLLAITEFGDRALLVEPRERRPPGTEWVLRVAARARRRWPRATLREDPILAGRTASRAFSGARRGRPGLHLSGTNFQLKVWEALLRVPAGAATTYAEVARRIGRPAAARAVASAVAANPVAWIIPCHRVLRSFGGLGGYRWGLERKQAMLGWEAARAGVRAVRTS